MAERLISPPRNWAVLRNHLGSLSVDVVTLRQSQSYASGAVLGFVVADDVWGQFDPDATDGRETAAAVLLEAVDATDARQKAQVLARLGEVWSDLLDWPIGVSDGEKSEAAADLAARHIIIRSEV